MSKLIDCEGEAAETQVWLKYAKECDYFSEDIFSAPHSTYDKIIGKLVNMGHHPED